MDVLSSADFRRIYAKLATETLVTANGHVIGRWVPIGRADEVRTYVGEGGSVTRVERDRFNSQPFTGPIPKVRK